MSLKCYKNWLYWHILAQFVDMGLVYGYLLHRLTLHYITLQGWKQTSGDPSGQTWNYHGITLLYNFTTALLYMVSSVTMTRIVAVLLNIY